MVEDNIKITGVCDHPDDDSEPKNDINIDPPILPVNPKESIDGTAPETTIEYNPEPIDPINVIAPQTTIKQSKEMA